MRLKFDDLFEDCTKYGTKIKTDSYREHGKHIIIDQGQEQIAGYTDLEEGLFSSVPALVFGDHTRIVKYVDKPFFLGADGVKVLRSKRNDADYRYLYYVLKNIRVPETGYNRHFKWLKESEIEYPNNLEQHAIVRLLDEIAQIIDARQRELQSLDDLIKARFVEMFGDPFSNPMKWKQMAFKKAGLRLSDGPFGSNLKSEHYSENGIRVIRLGNIGVGKFIDKDKSYIPEVHYEKLRKYTCKAGEIVIGTLGEPNLRACIIPDEVGIAINKADCVHYIPNPDLLDTRFVCQYINCPETLLFAQGMVHGQTRSRVSSGQIADMPIFIPPIRLQKEYADFVQQVDKSKFAVQKALDKAQLLFDNLMQQYFG